jgi:hypothetical protein
MTTSATVSLEASLRWREAGRRNLERSRLGNLKFFYGFSEAQHTSVYEAMFSS